MLRNNGKNGPGKTGTYTPGTRRSVENSNLPTVIDTTDRNKAYATPRGPQITLNNTRQAYTGGPSPTRVEHFSPKGLNGGSWLTAEAADAKLSNYNDVNNNPLPTFPGGGGGGGVTQLDMASVLKLLGQEPTQYGAPEQNVYQDVVIPDYVGSPFRAWDGSMYETMRNGITEGLAADRRAGMAAYGDARTELSQYQDPFSNRGYAQNQAMPAAMQRMMAANNVQFDPAETARGAQADVAFGNVLALLGGTAQQAQASNMRALGGDERRFGESLDSEGRSMQLDVNMTESKARQQYDIEKFAYGESIARANYEKNSQLAATNAAGQNAAAEANLAATNEVNQANTKMMNDYRENNANILIDLIASGQNIDPAILAEFM